MSLRFSCLKANICLFFKQYCGVNLRHCQANHCSPFGKDLSLFLRPEFPDSHTALVYVLLGPLSEASPVVELLEH